MLSNKLTFSLASLIVIFALAFATTSVMAVPGGPMVMITDAGTDAAPSTQAAYKARFTFSEPVKVASTGVTYQFINMNGARVGTSTSIDLTAATTTDNKTYIATVNLTSGGAIPFTHTGFYIDVAENAVTGTVGGQAHTQKLDIPPLLADRKVTLSVAMASSQTTGGGATDYVLTLTFDGTTGPSTAPTTADHITVTPAALKNSVAASGTDPAADTTNANVYTLAVVLPAGISEVMIELEQGYIKNTAVRIPPKEAVKPTVAIIAANHNATDKTFRLTVSFTGADPAVKSFDPLMDLTVTDSGMAPVTLSHITPMTERQPTATSQAYVAILQYDGLAVPPLTITTSTAYTKTIANMTAPTATVGMADSGNGQQPGNGGALAQPTGVMVGPNTAGDAYEVSWTEPTDKAGIGGYYVMYNPTVFVAVGMTTAAIGTDKPTSVTVWSTADTSDQSPTAAPAGAVAVPAADLLGLADLAPGGEQSPTSTMLAANGYAVLVHPNAMMADHGIDSDVKTIALSNMPNLAEFLDDGGTISLMGPSTASVKITEIMWGTDASLATEAAPGRIKYSQWIEIYNTTGTAVEVDFGTGGGWSIEFDDTYETGTGALDRVSNLGNPGYWEVKGSSGRTVSTENADAKNLVSMYRKLKQINNTAHDDHGENDGNPHRAGTWVASVKPRRHLSGMRVGTPGANPSVRIQDATAPTQQVIINEIGNGSGNTNDWVELLNTTDGEINLKKWELNLVMANSSGNPAETQKVSFPDNDNTKLPANGILLITNTPPSDPGNDLAAGVEINKSADDQVKTGVSSLYYVDSNLTLPDSGKYNLILRNANDKEGASTHVVDNGGTYFGAKNDGSINTEVWPLQATAAGHDNVIDAAGEAFSAGQVYQRNAKNSGIGEKHWKKVGFSGVGYDRVAKKSDENGGTPGYANNALKEKIADISDAEVTISEIMFDAGTGRRSVAQWIELYNSSMTQAVNLNGWKLEFQNARDENLDARLNATITLGAMTIAPNQTVLIVSTSGLNSGSGEFPPTRTVNLWTTHRDDLEMETRNDTVLSGIGFYLELTDKDGKFVDEVGNLDGNRRTADAPAWELPMSSEEGRRSSIIRRYDDGMASDGMTSAGWVSASSTQLAYAISHTYYGNADDLGTPGFHGGGPLPVSLSSFRPVRDKATGEVVIRWITQSELNNAGFNILRSETKNGEFKVVNTKGIIPGHGTTSEKHVYTWTDTSAKPNVVYYYQIEDVSLDGNRTTLRTTHLRGNVNAAGKLTTTWGDLKTQN